MKKLRIWNQLDKFGGDVHRYYMDGHTLAQTGRKFRSTAEKVYEFFKERDLKIKRGEKPPVIMWQGRRYLLTNGYYVRSEIGRAYNKSRLHHDVWEFHHGEIPFGYVVHHRNGVKTDNRISNLEIMTIETHGELHARTRIAKGVEAKAKKRRGRGLNAKPQEPKKKRPPRTERYISPEKKSDLELKMIEDRRQEMAENGDSERAGILLYLINEERARVRRLRLARNKRLGLSPENPTVRR